jgi:hypothetical protein
MKKRMKSALLLFFTGFKRNPVTLGDHLNPPAPNATHFAEGGAVVIETKSQI